MDIGINCEEGKFKFRVCGILQHNDKYLVVKMNDNPFYCLPGGHVELGEDTNQAVLREMREELGFEVKLEKLVAVNQNFFTGNDGRPFHELGFYYVVTAVDEKNISPNDYAREELDKGTLKHLAFKWATLEELKKMDFRPPFLTRCLENDHVEINVSRD